MTIQPPSGDQSGPDRRGTLLTPRSVLIVASSGIVAFGVVPVLLPTLSTISLLAALLFIALIVGLDQIIP